MPFIKLVDNHVCPTPSRRDDGSELRVGDQWRCDYVFTDQAEVQHPCNKIYEWSADQRDGGYWAQIN